MNSLTLALSPTTLRVAAQASVRKHESRQFELYDRVDVQQGLLRLSNLADK